MRSKKASAKPGPLSLQLDKLEHDDKVQDPSLPPNTNNDLPEQDDTVPGTVDETDAGSSTGKTGSKQGSKSKNKTGGKTKNTKQPHLDTVRRTSIGALTLRTSSPAFKGLLKQAGKLSTVLHVQDVIVKHDSSSSSSSTEIGFLHVVEALHYLAKLDQVFMQRLLDYQDIEAAGVTFREDNPVDLAYQIIGHDGKLIYVMEQHRIFCTSFILFSRQSFENTFYDRSGYKVLKVIGPTVYMSKMFSPIQITDGHGRMLGYIKPFGMRVNYSVYNARNERIFLIASNKYIPNPTTVFKILHLGHKAGEIRNAWCLTHPELIFLDARDTGIVFPEELDEREKALLIGCMTLIEFTWYSPLTRLKLVFVLTAFCLSAFTLILFAIPIMLDKPLDENETLKYYITEKPHLN